MIDIQDIFVSFDSHTVLDGLSLQIQTGETMVIIGRSGCGKSVLLKHIIGLMRPQSGRVLIDGVDVNHLSGHALDQLRMKFGMLFQNAALFDSMSVEDNVAFALREHTSMTPDAIRKRVRECLQVVGLGNVEALYPAELSGGMRKRVGLARALAIRPEILLYDEPTTGIDPIMGDLINELIVTLRDRLRVTSVVVTHDMRSAEKVADRIAMLYNGKIIAVGTPKEIAQSENPYVQQFIHGSSSGPIQEGLPDPSVLSSWASKAVRAPTGAEHNAS